jgi:hypothetical protein
MASTWPDVRRRLRAATIREAVLLALLYAVPQLRRFRRWYWRGVLAAGLVGGAIGVLAAYRERGRPAPGRARCSD